VGQHEIGDGFHHRAKDQDVAHANPLGEWQHERTDQESCDRDTGERAQDERSRRAVLQQEDEHEGATSQLGEHGDCYMQIGAVHR